MIKKQDFIKRILKILEKDLDKILPEEETLDEMYGLLLEYLKKKFSNKW